MKLYDFIIVGSGLAGLNAALMAAQKGSVVLITKKALKASNTYYAQGGIATVWNQDDSFKKHIEDTLKAGCFHNNRKVVEFIVKNGPSTIQQLLNLGVKFTEKNHKLSLHREGGHSENRIIHSGDHTGKTIEEKMIENVKKNSSITILENTFAKDLLVQKKRCYGVQVLRKGKCENIFGKKIILATGGLGQLYAKTTNPAVATGDGIAMAWRAGCKLEDMEFIQFHPTAFDEKKFPLFLLSEALRGAGAILLNSKKVRFMAEYHKDGELAPRDVVSRAIFKEQKKGPVYLSFGGKKVSKEFPQISTYLQKKGFDLEKDFIPVTPAAHFSCGGIKTNIKGETNIKNLYACGEVACTGLHGANRLASNSLLEAAVMSSQIINQIPSQNIWTFKNFPLPEQRSMPKKKSRNTQRIRKKLQEIMWKKAGIIRNKKGLTEAIKNIKTLQESLPNETEWEILETKNMLETTLFIIKEALKRRKSLGTHFRID